jgi:hypothetical protein
MTSIEGAGFKQLEMVAFRLRAAADGRLKNRLRASVRSITTPLINDVRQAAKRDLPKKGGLNEWVASGRFTTSTLLSANNVGVRIIRKGQFNGQAQTFRHPVFGVWRPGVPPQHVEVKWFYGTLAERAPEKAISAIHTAFEQIALEITRG